jgi:hypothetical protein
LIEDAASESPTAADDAGPGQPDPEAGASQNQVQVLLSLAGDIMLFHAADMEPYAEIPVKQHREVLGIKSEAFKSWLLYAYFTRTRSAPSEQALNIAIRTLGAQACHEGQERQVFIRTGTNGECHYIDLCDADWRVIEIKAGAWSILDQSPVAFRRVSGMLPLPEPVQGGSLDLLRGFLNFASDDDFKLMIAWLVFSHRPNGPYPVLIIQGEQGSAKSTTSRVLRRLVDPHTTELRSEPRNTQDLMIAAINSWLVALDNLSGVRPELSDGLCRLATGGGFAARALYTNKEEAHFSAMRPILLNGIDDVAERPDLLDRAILLRLPAIPEEDRKEEAEFWGQFEAAQGAILGVLLDAYAKAVDILPAVHVDRHPRMADFARSGEAVGRALGWGEGAFLRAYWSNIEGVTESAAEASSVATAILGLMADRETWKGTPSELLAALAEIVSEKEAKAPGWPRNAKGLSTQLVRLAPVLRKLGIQIERPEIRTRKGRPVFLTKTAPLQTETLPSQQSQQSQIGARSNNHNDLRSDATCDGPVTVVTVPSHTVTVPSQHRPIDKLLCGSELHKPSDGCDGCDGAKSILSTSPETDPWFKEVTWTV